MTSLEQVGDLLAVRIRIDSAAVLCVQLLHPELPCLAMVESTIYRVA